MLHTPADAKTLPPTILAGLLFLVGILTLVLQSVLAREVLVLSPGGEVSLGLFYGAWLIWIGIGAALHLASRPSRTRPTVLLPWATLALPAAGWAALVALQRAEIHLQPDPTHLLTFTSLVAIVFLITACVGLPAGFIFSLACQAAQPPTLSTPLRTSDARRVAALFAAEALGGFAGGVVHAFLLAGRFPPPQVVAFATIAAAAFAGAWAWRLRTPGKPILATASLACLVASACVLTPSGRHQIDRARRTRFERQHPGYTWLATADSRHDRLELARLDDQYILFAGGQPALTTPDPVSAAELAALAATQLPQGPRRVLALGTPSPDLQREILRWPTVQRLTVVRLDATADRLLARHLPNRLAPPPESDRLRRIETDPRAYLNRPPPNSHQLHDIILILAPAPLSAAANRLYTQQFYQRAHTHLAPQGALIATMPAAPNYLGQDLAQLTASIVRTLRTVFPNVLLTPGHEMHIIAGCDDISIDPHTLATRYQTIRPEPSPHYPPQRFHTTLPPNQTRALAQRMAHIQAPLNTDTRPAAYFLATLLWTRFTASPPLRATLHALRHATPQYILALIAIFIAARLAHLLDNRHHAAPEHTDRFHATLTIACLGAVGMALSLTVLLAYQTAAGLLYERIALLAGTYMAGLGLGAAIVPLARPTPAAARAALIAVLAFLAAILAALPHLTALPPAILLAPPAALSGAAFALAAALHNAAATQTGPTLDAADHAGAALGALLTGTILLPLLGIQTTAQLAATIPCGLILAHTLAAIIHRDRSAPPPRPAPPDTLRRYAWLLVAILAAAWATGYHTRPHPEPKDEPQPPAALAPLQAPARWQYRDNPFPHYIAQGAPRPRAAFTTDHTAPDVQGYIAPITLLLDIDTTQIRNIRLINCQETPGYVRRLPQWLQRLEGRPADKSIVLGRDIDAMTGSTITSRAVVETINRSIESARNRLFLATQHPQHTSRATWVRNLKTPAPLILIAAFLVFVPVYLVGGLWTRRIFLLLIVLICGFYLNAQLSILEIGHASLGRLPSANRPEGLVLLFGALAAALLWGSAFCGYLCPFGALQELVATLTGRDRRRPFLTGPLRSLRAMRYLLLAATLIACFLTWGRGPWADWSLLQRAFLIEKSALAWAVAIAVILASAAIPRLWCLYFCPLGAALSLSNRIAILRSTRFFRKPQYGRCDLGAVASRPRDCLRCNRCLLLAAKPVAVPRRARLALLSLPGLAFLALAVLYWTSPDRPETSDLPPAERATGAAVERPQSEPTEPQPQQARGRRRRGRRREQGSPIDEAVRAGRLSDKEARYYHPIESE